MNLVELQILFQQKIEDVNLAFSEVDRPNTFTIVNYLNKSIDQHLQQKYLALPTFEQRLVAIDMSHDELYQLLSNIQLSDGEFLTQFNWDTRGRKYWGPDDILIPISISVEVTREEIYVTGQERMFCEMVSRKQAERVISDSTDKVMFPKPLGLWYDRKYFMIIGDAYTTEILDPQLTYLKKPFTLSFDYTQFDTTSATINIGVGGDLPIPDGSYFLMRSRSQYVSAGGSPSIYQPGEKVIKVNGYNEIQKVDEDISVGYPFGLTDTPEFPEYMHEGIVEKAVSLFLDEAKFKLVSKSNN